MPRRRKKSSLETLLEELDHRAGVETARNAARAGELIDEVLRLKPTIADDFHAIGCALEDLSARAIYQAVGCESFEALLKREKLFGKSQAYKLMAVAGAYPAPRARSLGFEKAYALVAYTEATPADDVARSLAEGDPRIGDKRLKTMSVRDLQEATRRVRGAKRERSGPEREARRVAREVQRQLRADGAKSAEARAKRNGGRWRIQIELGVDEVGALG